MTIEHVDFVNEYAAIVRGEHPNWKGDATLNAETFARRIGYDFPGDADVFAQSLLDAATEYSLLSGISPNGVKRIASMVREGKRRALREAKAEGRL